MTITEPTPTNLDVDDVATETIEPTALDEALVEDEMLVEEISIDGMCGVY